MSVILSVDTTSNDVIIVGLNADGKILELKQKLSRQKAQVVLTIIIQLLERKKLKLKDITQLRVNPGPGSFTGIRVGLTVVNTLSFLLKVPINDKQVGQFEIPKYT